MFDCVHEGLIQVSQDAPELTDGEDANIEDDEESHKLDRDGARQHGSCCCQPDPPGRGKGLFNGPELRHCEEGARYEEQEDGVKENVSVEDEDSDIEYEEPGCKEGSCQ